MRAAVLDIGTNTVKILVADVSILEGSPSTAIKSATTDSGDAVPPTFITPVFEDALTTRIGENVHETRELNPAAIWRTLSAIGDFSSRARALGAEKILVFATSAVRDARNSQHFLDGVESTTGLSVRILSGDEEARFAFAGVTSDPEFAGRTIRTIDIGGGSTEICFGDAGGLRAHQSLNIGAVRLTEMFLESDPPKENEMGQLLKHIQTALKALSADVGASVSDAPLVATGGTATTLGAIEMRRRGAKRKRPGTAASTPSRTPAIGHLGIASAEARVYAGVDHHELTTLPELLDWLRRIPLAERKNVDGLPPERADIILAGAAILSESMRWLGASGATVSIRGVRYGALALGFGAADC